MASGNESRTASPTKRQALTPASKNRVNKPWRMSYSPQKPRRPLPSESRIPSPVKDKLSKLPSSCALSDVNLAGTKIPSPLRRSSKRPKLGLADFEIGKKLGKGKFGKVYCVRHKQSGFVCAMKVMDKSEIVQFNVMKQIRREVEIQSNLNHPNLTKLYGFFHDEKRVYLLMEYLVNGELYRLLKHHGAFHETMTANYIYQIADALEYMHKRNIIHRDLKPENILIGFNNTVKLSDFGWSIYVPRGHRRTTLCGTIDYLSPELIDNREYNETVDVWALGVLTYELITGSPPFEEDNKQKTYTRIRNGDLKFPETMSRDAVDLISKLLRNNPRDRMALADIKKHPWITKRLSYM